MCSEGAELAADIAQLLPGDGRTSARAPGLIIHHQGRRGSCVSASVDLRLLAEVIAECQVINGNPKPPVAGVDICPPERMLARVKQQPRRRLPCSVAECDARKARGGTGPYGYAEDRVSGCGRGGCFCLFLSRDPFAQVSCGSDFDVGVPVHLQRSVCPCRSIYFDKHTCTQVVGCGGDFDVCLAVGNGSGWPGVLDEAEAGGSHCSGACKGVLKDIVISGPDLEALVQAAEADFAAWDPAALVRVCACVGGFCMYLVWHIVCMSPCTHAV